MDLKLITAPTIELIPLADMKLFLRIEHGNEDALLTAMTKAAIRCAEHYTRRAFLTQTWDLFLDEFPEFDEDKTPFGEIVLPFPPLQSVTHVKYLDTSGVEQTWASTNYQLDQGNDTGHSRLAPKPNIGWPQLGTGYLHAVRVRFVCGWTVTNLVPLDVVQAVKETVAYYYEHRGDDTLGNLEDSLPPVAKYLLGHWRSFLFT